MDKKGKTVLIYLEDILVELSPMIVHLVKQLPPSLKVYFRDVDGIETREQCFSRKTPSIVNWLCSDPDDLDNLIKCNFIIIDLLNRNDLYQNLNLTKFGKGLLSLDEKAKNYYPFKKIYILSDYIKNTTLLEKSKKEFISNLTKKMNIPIDYISIKEDKLCEHVKEIGIHDIFIGDMGPISKLVLDPDIKLNTKEFLFPNTEYNKKALTKELKYAIGISGATISSFEI